MQSWAPCGWLILFFRNFFPRKGRTRNLEVLRGERRGEGQGDAPPRSALDREPCAQVSWSGVGGA